MRIVAVGLIVALVFAVSADGQSNAEQAATPLSALEFLVGGCWSGKGPRGETDQHCFSKMLGGHFIRDVHETVGLPKPYSGETVYHWDAKNAIVRFTYWNSNGGVSTGTMLVEDGRLVFPETYEGKDGKRSEYRNVWIREGADAYVARMDLKKGDAWVEQFRIVYKRIPDGVAKSHSRDGFHF